MSGRLALGSLLALAAGCATAGAGAPAGYPPAQVTGGRVIEVGPLALIEVSGEPAELGERLGALCGRELAAGLEAALAARGERERAALLERAAAAEADVLPAQREELDALGDSLGVGPVRLLALDALAVPRGGLVLAGPAATTTGETLVARSLTAPPLAPALVLRRPRGRLAYVALGAPGELGVALGMNEAGLVVTVLAREGQAPGATSARQRARAVLEQARDVGEALRLLAAAELPGGVTLGLADPDRVALARWQDGLRVPRATDGLLTVSDGVTALGVQLDAEARRLSDLTHPRRGALDRELLGRIVAGAAPSEPAGGLAVVLEPTARRLHLAPGPGEWVGIDLAAALAAPGAAVPVSRRPAAAPFPTTAERDYPGELLRAAHAARYQAEIDALGAEPPGPGVLTRWRALLRALAPSLVRPEPGLEAHGRALLLPLARGYLEALVATFPRWREDGAQRRALTDHARALAPFAPLLTPDLRRELAALPTPDR